MEPQAELFTEACCAETVHLLLRGGTEPAMKLCDDKDLQGLLKAIGNQYVASRIRKATAVSTIAIFRDLFETKNIIRLRNMIRSLTNSFSALEEADRHHGWELSQQLRKCVPERFLDIALTVARSDAEVLRGDLNARLNDITALIKEAEHGSNYSKTVRSANLDGYFERALLKASRIPGSTNSTHVGETICGMIANRYCYSDAAPAPHAMAREVMLRESRCAFSYTLSKAFGKGVLLLHYLCRPSRWEESRGPEPNALSLGCTAAMIYCPDLTTMFDGLHSSVLDRLTDRIEPRATLNIVSDEDHITGGKPLKFLLS